MTEPTNPYDELSDRARWFMENFDELGIAEICASNETAAKRAEADRDGAYRERAQLLAWLAAIVPSAITLAPDVDEPGWKLLFLHPDDTQLSWHISPRDDDLFDHIERAVCDDPRVQWDGHTTAEKYERIRAITAARTAPDNPPTTRHAADGSAPAAHACGCSDPACDDAPCRYCKTCLASVAPAVAAPATPADGLREQYAAAIRAKVDGSEGCANGHRLADAVLAVRDRRMEQVTAERDQAHVDLARWLRRLAKTADRAKHAEAAIARVRSLAADMRDWCSPHGIAVDYAQRIDAALDAPKEPTR